MKYAIVDRIFNNYDADFERFNILSKKLNYKTIKNDEISTINNLAERFFLLIRDDLSIITIIKIVFLLVRNKKARVEFLCLELYSISLKAIVSDFNFNKKFPNSFKTLLYPFFLIQLRLAKYILFRFIIKFWCDCLYLPSEARAIYFSSKNNKLLIKVLPNLPLKSFSDLQNHNLDNFKEFEYLYLPGRINNQKELIEILEFAYNNQIKVVVSSNEKVSLLDNVKYSETLIETGPIPHYKVLVFMKNCLAGIILYNSKSINQKFAASSKLFEFLYFNKFVIISQNFGVMKEIEKYSIKKFKVINGLKNSKKAFLYDFDLKNNEFDSRFEYENYINKI
jgi:uncharacterized protein (UPF0248 family)